MPSFSHLPCLALAQAKPNSQPQTLKRSLLILSACSSAPSQCYRETLPVAWQNFSPAYCPPTGSLLNLALMQELSLDPPQPARKEVSLDGLPCAPPNAALPSDRMKPAQLRRSEGSSQGSHWPVAPAAGRDKLRAWVEAAALSLSHTKIGNYKHNPVKKTQQHKPIRICGRVATKPAGSKGKNPGLIEMRSETPSVLGRS